MTKLSPMVHKNQTNVAIKTAIYTTKEVGHLG